MPSQPRLRTLPSAGAPGPIAVMGPCQWELLNVFIRLGVSRRFHLLCSSHLLKCLTPRMVELLKQEWKTDGLQTSQVFRAGRNRPIFQRLHKFNRRLVLMNRYVVEDQGWRDVNLS